MTNQILGAVELGLVYGLMVLGVYITFRILKIPDLTVDGSITLGMAISAMVINTGQPWAPFAALLLAMLAGAAAGSVTAFFQTKLKIPPILAGIMTMSALYSVNLLIMNNGTPNISILGSPTLFSMFQRSFGVSKHTAMILVGLLICVVVVALVEFFFTTHTGLCICATGDNEEMVRAAGISSDNMKLLGLAVSNGFVGLAGGLLAQYQGYADIGMGVGMVVIGLASVIIGEVIFGTSCLLRRLIAVCLGAIVYRLVLAIALNFGMQATDMKLVSAVIVVIALSLGVLGESFSIRKKKRGAGNA